MDDCFAGLERAYVRKSAASKVGMNTGCVFCQARCSEELLPDQVLLLNGDRAGEVLRQAEYRLQPTELYTPLPLNPLPNWFPPFELRTLFVIDEAAVWFCDQALIGKSFFWERRHILTLAATFWDKRIDIKGDEIARVLIAHGMPDRLSDKLIFEFEFAVSAMVGAGGRGAIKKRRDAGAAQNQWIAAMRQWGR